MAKRGRGKRGVSTCSKRQGDQNLHVEFDVNNQPIGQAGVQFMSWVGVKTKAKFSYHKDTREFGAHEWDELWLELKAEYNIQEDRPKAYVLRRAKKIATNFRSTLVVDYVRTGKNACKKYPFMDESKWKGFVARKTTSEFLEISAKARASASENKDYARLGRTGYKGKEADIDNIWKQLQTRYDFLKDIDDERSIKFIVSRARTLPVSRARRNPASKGKRPTESKQYFLAEDIQGYAAELDRFEKEMKRDGTYDMRRSDPLIKLKGPEHGGRSRTVSDAIGKTKVHGGLFKGAKKRNDNNEPTTQERSYAGMDSSEGFNGYNSGSNTDYLVIEENSRCELLHPWNVNSDQTIAFGNVYPTSIRILHNVPMHDDCVKVQVDDVVGGCEDVLLPDVSCNDEINSIGQALNYFIQWPRRLIKLLNEETRRSSSESLLGSTSCYRPQMVHVDEYDQPESSHRQTHSSFQQQMQFDTDFTDLFENQDVDTGLDNKSSYQPVNMGLNNMFGGLQPYEALKNLESTPAPSKNIEPNPNQPLIDAFEKLKYRPRNIQVLGERLAKHVGDDQTIEHSSPAGMYPDIDTEWMEYEGLVQFLVNGWVDITIMHWAEKYFFEMVKNNRETPSRCAFLNPHKINRDECDTNVEAVKAHILEVQRLHKDKPYIVAPYHAGSHWTLFIVSIRYKRGYILDSLKVKNSKDCYLLSGVIEDAFKMRNKFTWEMVQCKKQDSTWECGYVVLQHMLDFVSRLQYNFPAHMWNDTNDITQEEIDMLVAGYMELFVKQVYGDED